MPKRGTRREFVQTAALSSLAAVAKPGWHHGAGALASGKNTHAQGLTQFVDVFIGTGGHGHTYPGATVPFGMVQLSPDTWTGGWDHCSGYHHDDTSLMGFSHTHLSGTGAADLLVVGHTPRVLGNVGWDDELIGRAFPQLAVVRPEQGGSWTGSPLLFIAVTPVGRHGMGLQAIGSF